MLAVNSREWLTSTMATRLSIILMLSRSLPIRLNDSSQWRKWYFRKLWTCSLSHIMLPPSFKWYTQYWQAYWMSGGRCESIVCLSISARGLSGIWRSQISFLIYLLIDKRWRHLVASFVWTSFSSTQKGFIPRFSGSTRKSRNDKWSSRIGRSEREGMLRTEWRRSVLLSTIPSETPSSRSRESSRKRTSENDDRADDLLEFFYYISLLYISNSDE
jgi:hypothetical protein